MAISERPTTAAEQKAQYDERGYVVFPEMLSKPRWPSSDRHWTSCSPRRMLCPTTS